MTAPVVFFMFLNAFAPVVVNDDYITTLVFQEPIVKPHTGASKHKLKIEKSKNSKMLFIKSVGRSVRTNLSVMGRSGKLYSFLIVTGDRPHSMVIIQDGKKDKAFKDVKNLRGVIIQEGANTARVLNESKEKITVNSIEVVRGARIELPKGAPVFINNKRVHR